MVKNGIIGYADGASLIAAGIHSAEDLLFLTRSGFAFVAENAQLSETEIKGIVKRILRRYCPVPQRASAIFEDWREKNSIIQTGNPPGGIFTSELTEIAGPSAVGKTQFCLSLSDLEIKLQSAFGLSRNTSDGLHIDSFLVNLKMVVVDSIGSLFAPILGGASMVGHCMLLDIVQKIQRMMTKYSIAVLVTNHTTIARGGNSEHVQAAMGETWSRLPCVSLMITAFSSDVRRLTIRKSNKNASQAYTHFLITEMGLSDLNG
ncbi:hypothetical protein GUITHDRAFT_116717 [Guillardia theta CCMP2712]|uniref:RecA family profile 1 domain-containing protein n=1 Tax=Guillardia theta (strain CCMP2712) TaxID=905079 RepID=L1IMM0_GUITC|nr:hypothetical protein GUITHDRAFT_116717 [Guillardia theta CCMP2712]EKX37139.1 hypothetical protein GUITHDRAFT_116717 [Guillardia theta CCMP2712]|eukprot:XP_005824119.1 hypothetical protein GUITHDRAFT_116717 [Guillardia theta CCMP2712]